MGVIQSSARGNSKGTKARRRIDERRFTDSPQPQQSINTYDGTLPSLSAQYSSTEGSLSSRHQTGSYSSTSQNSVSPPASTSIPNTTSALQKAFSRRRISNQTADTSMSLGPSNNSILQNSTRPSEDVGNDSDNRWFLGRRYHNTDSLYSLPNDTEEVDRLHIEHYVFKMLMGGKMVHVPVPKDGRVIDLGCGAATWIMDMATEMTTTQFVGIDISPIFPKAIHPRNCTFYKADLLKLPEPDNSFDMVYQRSLAVAFTAELWRQALQQAFRILKPGGWFESVETDLTIQDAGPQITLCFDYIMVSMASQNVDPRIVPSLDRIMVSVGFVEVQVKEYCVPVGEWGGKVGQVWKQNLFAALELVKPYLSLGGRMTESQAADLVQNAGSETKDYRGYQIVYVCYGRKPLS